MRDTPRTPHPTTVVLEPDVSLFVALELSKSVWLIAASALRR